MSTQTPTRRSRRWIEDWRPEDPDFWEATGRRVARRNLVWSIFAEHLGCSVWLIWSVSSAFLVATGFDYTPQQLFLLVALPNLVGSLLRLPYTFAVPKFGGRNWTMASAALLLIPTLGFAYAVQRPDTPYWVFCLIAATAGLGGGNFASSMANINFFYPAAKKGAALGLNAAGGNVGVALIQLLLPVIVGGAGIFGLVKASEGGIDLQRAAWVYAGLAIVATLAAYFFMDNLSTAKSSPREQLQVVRYGAGQEYRPHLDACVEGCDRVNQPRINRRATLLVYLTDDFEAGSTHFPAIGTRVRPRRGDGVLFYNTDADTGGELPDSLHAGEPVTAGTKWVANCWVRSDPAATRV